MLENLKIAKPCPANWADMTGDERMRFCSLCKLHVYNLSGMKRDEAEDLISKTEGDICVRLYKRADGTVITQDCPVGLAALKRRVASLLAAGAALVAVTLSVFRIPETETSPKTEPTATRPVEKPPVGPTGPKIDDEPRHTMGRISIHRGE